jgi:hypothetical protein
MSSRQWTELEVYDSFEPIGLRPLTQVLSQLLARVVNVTSGKNSVTARWQHFMPGHIEAEEPYKQEPGDILKVFQTMAKAQNQDSRTSPSKSIRKKQQRRER